MSIQKLLAASGLQTGRAAAAALLLKLSLGHSACGASRDAWLSRGIPYGKDSCATLLLATTAARLLLPADALTLLSRGRGIKQVKAVLLPVAATTAT